MRRAIDIVVSAAVLILLSPVLAVVFLVAAVETGGRPLYRAARIGLHGRPFRMYKVRTMRTSGAHGSPITGKDDRRITRAGRVLRDTKLDEIPQFFNVLRGEMTLVGPRPEAPELVALYTPEERVVLRTKPGVTGVSQLHAGREADGIPAGAEGVSYYAREVMPAKIRMDLAYMSVRTARTDLSVVLRTVSYVMRSLLV